METFGLNELGDAVRHHRKVAGLTQLELADLAGVGKTLIFDLEKGKASVQLDTLVKILAALNIQAEFRSPLRAPTVGGAHAKT